MNMFLSISETKTEQVNNNDTVFCHGIIAVVSPLYFFLISC